MVKPRVVVSSCLAGENVRYDGKPVYDPIIDKILEFVEPIKVCPEVSIGLPVPRNRIVLVKENDIYKVYQLPKGKDLTENLVKFSKKFLYSLKDIDGFILKAKSPSCGLQGTKTYRTPLGNEFIGRRKGIFALQVLDLYPNFPKADEIDLQDWYKRYIFLTSLYLFANYRNFKNKKEFAEKYKYILKLLNEKKFNEFYKTPSYENFQKFFHKNLSPQFIKNKIPNFKSKLFNNPTFQKRYLIFPKELLNIEKKKRGKNL